MSKPKYTAENCEILAETVVASMSNEELKQFVFDDLYAIMVKDEEVFDTNLEGNWEYEDE
tara:strand:- start:3 stop:182 length:180 start_codon:yes stop_codon:yes gene_type:complete